MKKEEIIKKLEEELNKILIENPDLHIVEARRMCIIKLGLQQINPYSKKGYIEPKNCIQFGSKVGYDHIFFIKEN